MDTIAYALSVPLSRLNSVSAAWAGERPLAFQSRDLPGVMGAVCR
jgi:hypothetical protein